MFFLFSDAGIKKILVALNVELKKIKEKEKKTYAGMFDKLASKDAEKEDISTEKI